MTESTTAPVSASPSLPKRRSSSLIVILLLLIIGGLLLWHFGIFAGNKKVALVTSGEGPYWDLVLAGAKDAADQYNVDLTVVRSKSDAEAQSQAIKDLLGGGYDGIAISPISAVSQTVLLGTVATTTTLITFDSDVPVARRLCFVGTDNYEAGRTCGEQVRQTVPDGGEIIVSMGSAEKDNTLRRRQGLIDALLGRTDEPNRPSDPIDQPLKGEKYTIVATMVDGSEAVKATELTTQALKDHPNVKCFVGLLSYSAPAIMEAVEQAKMSDKVQIIGFDVSPKTLDAIEAGRIRATIMQDQYGCGFQAVRILADNAHQNYGGLPMFQAHTLSCEVVNKENLATTREKLLEHTAPTTAKSTS